MVMTPLRPKTDTERLADAHSEIDRLRAELRDVTETKNALQARVDGDDEMARWWLQQKVNRQRVALDRLTVRNTSLRLALRTIHGLGRGLSRGEWIAARNGAQHLRVTEEAPTAD